jgi:uncharacterized protein (DUF58 family)
MTLVTKIKTMITRQFNLWLARRIPRSSKQAINHKNIFIMPSRFGTAFVLFTLLVFLLGTNYQNNIIILVSYLLISFFIVVLLHSFYNLSGLHFFAPSQIKGFVDSSIAFPLVVASDKARFNINITFLPVNDAINGHYVGELVTKIPEVKSGDTEIYVPYTPIKRGNYDLERMTIVSEYGFGLFRTWTRLDFAQQVIAYPKPVVFDLAAINADNIINDTKTSSVTLPNRPLKGSDDFYQLQQYRMGEPKSRVAWKQLARGQGWLTKQYQQQQCPDIMLDLNAMPSLDFETRLGMLCFAICEHLNQQLGFSLQLPNEPLRNLVSSQSDIAEFGAQCLAVLASYHEESHAENPRGDQQEHLQKNQKKQSLI